MQNYCKTIGALAAASALVAGNAQAEVEYELHGGYSSEYVFRGISVGDNMLESGLDAAYEWNGLSISGGVWTATFNHGTDANGGWESETMTEIDWYTEVSKDFGFLTASVGYIYYWNLSELGLDDQEVYFSVSHDFGYFNAYATYFWNVDEDTSATNVGYTEVGVSKGFELSPCLVLNVSSNVGYLAEEGEFTSLTSKVSLDWGFVEHAKLSPFVSFALALGEEDRTAWSETSNELVVGSILSVSF